MRGTDKARLFCVVEMFAEGQEFLAECPVEPRRALVRRKKIGTRREDRH